MQLSITSVPFHRFLICLLPEFLYADSNIYLKNYPWNINNYLPVISYRRFPLNYQ